jgi:hypothetical protein
MPTTEKLDTILDHIQFPKLPDAENMAVDLFIKYDAIDDLLKAFDTTDSLVTINIPDIMVEDFNDAFPDESLEKAISSAINKILQAYINSINSK